MSSTDRLRRCLLDRCASFLARPLPQTRPRGSSSMRPRWDGVVDWGLYRGARGLSIESPAPRASEVAVSPTARGDTFDMPLADSDSSPGSSGRPCEPGDLTL